MTVEADIRTALLNECPRVRFDFAAVGTQRPYVTVQQVGGNVINPIGNTVPDKQHGEFQVNVWADSREAASLLALAIEARLRTTTTFQARPRSAPVADFDPDVPVYGTRQDWSIWSSR